MVGVFSLFMVVSSVRCGGTGDEPTSSSSSGAGGTTTSGDTTPPVISGGSPQGTLSGGTTEATLQVTTDEPATCRYDVIEDQPYDGLATAFEQTGDTMHSATLTSLMDGASYTFYVRCIDDAGNENDADYTVTFGVGEQQVPLARCANRPSTYTTTIAGMDFSEEVPTGTNTERPIPGSEWSVIYDLDANNQSHFSKIQDPSAPQSPPDVWQIYHPAGDYGEYGEGGGSGFGNIFRYFPSPASEVYACVFMKLSDPFWFHGISHKWLNMFTSSSIVLVQLHHYGEFFEAADIATDNPFPPQTNISPTLNEWHQIEVQIEAGGSGLVRVWVDGVLSSQYDGVPVAAGDAFGNFGLFHFLGGGGFDLADDQYVYYDDVLLATP